MSDPVVVNVVQRGINTVVTRVVQPLTVEVRTGTLGPQGPPGVDIGPRFYVGTTPPADTSLIWINTN